MRPLLVVVAFLGGFLAAGVATAAPVLAHAELKSAAPAAGSSVDALPETVELTFTEVVGQPASVAITGPGGVAVADGAPEVLDKTLTQQVGSETGTPAGVYTVSYQVTSADGHPISGTVRFTVGTAGTATAVDDTTEAAGVGAGIVGGLLAVLLVALGLVALSLTRLVRQVADA